MRFGIFYEHQLPRPWNSGEEQQLILDALEQIELADRIGIDYVWEVEHHFLEEYSHSSAPEVFLAAASQRTKRIRLGHGIVQLPPVHRSTSGCTPSRLSVHSPTATHMLVAGHDTASSSADIAPGGTAAVWGYQKGACQRSARLP